MEQACRGKLDNKPVVEDEVEPVSAEVADRARWQQEAQAKSPIPSQTTMVAGEEESPVAPMAPAKSLASEYIGHESEAALDRGWRPGRVLSMLSLGLLAFHRQGRTKSNTQAPGFPVVSSRVRKRQKGEVSATLLRRREVDH